jgi:tetratricopeptide (TPR) repeat protein
MNLINSTMITKFKLNLGSKHYLLLVILITSIVYSNIFKNELVWDDYSFIVEWQQTRDLKANFVNFWLGNLPIRHKGVYRPIRSIVYGLDYSLWKTNPVGYHLQSLVIHLITISLVFYISLKIIKDKTAALIAATTFGLHPAHVETITWITTSFDAIGVMLALGSLAGFIKYRETKRVWWQVISVVLAASAFFTYEMTLTLPLLIGLYDWLIEKHDWRQIWKDCLPYLSFAGIYILIRFGVLHISARENYMLGSKVFTLKVMLVAIVKYAWVLIWPMHLSVNHEILPTITTLFYHDFNPNQSIIVPSWFHPKVLGAIVILLSGLFVTWRCRKKWPLISLSLLWFFLALLPVLQIFPQSIIFAEKYLYLASLSICWLSAFAWLKLNNYLVHTKQKNAKNVVNVILAILLIMLGTRTFVRNFTWKDSVTLWGKSLTDEKASKKSAYIYNNLGMAYQLNGNMSKAYENIEIAIKLNDYSVINLVNYGLVLIDKGQINEALSYLEKAKMLNPNYADAYTYLALIYDKQNRFIEAVNEYKKALELKDDSVVANRYLALMYYRVGDYDNAKFYLDKTIKLDPNDIQTYNLFGLAYHQQGKYKEAEASFLKSISIAPKSAEAYNNLGNLYFDLKRYKEARKMFEKALEINPLHPFADKNLKDLEAAMGNTQ